MRQLSASTIVGDAMEGSHVLKVDGYSKTKGLDNGKFIKSGTFNIGGHSWFMRYYPDGDAKDNAEWISIYLDLDHTNAKEVRIHSSFSLLDHVGEPVSSSYIREGNATFTTNKRSWVYQRFIKRRALEESHKLKDDCFRIRCDVTVKNLVGTGATTQSIVVPPSDMHRHISNLLSSEKGADVIFEVDGETFAEHRIVLAARSSVFMAEFFGPMKENANCIRVDDMEARVFKVMLHFIYNDFLPSMGVGEEMAMVQHLLVAADRYDLKRLKLICEDKLCNYIDKSTVVTTLVLAEQHSSRGLKEACFAFLASRGNLKEVMATSGYDHLKNSCPSLHEELVAMLRSNVTRSYWCFPFQ